MIQFKKIEIISAIAIVVAFFLPWVSFGGLFSFSGYQLPNGASMLAEFGSAFSDEEMTTNNYAWAVYLVPLLSLAVLLVDYLGKSIKTICLIASGVNVAGFIYSILLLEGEIGAYGIGIWITLLASIVMAAAALGLIKANQA